MWRCYRCKLWSFVNMTWSLNESFVLIRNEKFKTNRLNWLLIIWTSKHQRSGQETFILVLILVLVLPRLFRCFKVRQWNNWLFVRYQFKDWILRNGYVNEIFNIFDLTEKILHNRWRCITVRYFVKRRNLSQWV